MGTARGDLGKLARAQERLLKAEAAALQLRAERDAAMREAMVHAENTYVVVHERTGISRATIAKAQTRR